MIGADSLVPPTWAQVEDVLVVGQYPARPPLPGSAAAETSAMARLAQPVPEPAAAASASLTLEQPLPAPLHALSLQPREVEVALTRLVPPTAVTYFEEDGKLPPW